MWFQWLWLMWNVNSPAHWAGTNASSTIKRKINAHPIIIWKWSIHFTSLSVLFILLHSRMNLLHSSMNLLHSSMNLLHSSMNQELSEKHFCYQGSQNENTDNFRYGPRLLLHCLCYEPLAWSMIGGLLNHQHAGNLWHWAHELSTDPRVCVCSSNIEGLML